MMLTNSSNDLQKYYHNYENHVNWSWRHGWCYRRRAHKGKDIQGRGHHCQRSVKEVLNRFAGTGVKVTNDNVKAIDGADVVCVCVKPWLVQKVLEELCPSF